MLSVRLKNEIRKNPTLAPFYHYARDWKFLRRAKKLEKRALPGTVIVELTNHCNLRCAKCPTYETKRGKGMISPETYRKILKDIEMGGVPVGLYLNGAGEALLHESLLPFIQEAKRIPNVTSLGFCTNGLGLVPELSKKLLENGLTDLKVSLDTVDPQTYLKVNRVDGYQQVVDNVIEFCRLKKAGGYNCDVTLKVTLYKEDRELIEKIRTIWNQHVDKIRVTKLHNWLGLRGKRKESARTRACEMIWTQVQILWDGQITLCCFDNMEGFFNMGNINDVNLSRYWTQDQRLGGVRKDHMAGDFSRLPMCATCNADVYETIEFFDS